MKYFLLLLVLSACALTGRANSDSLIHSLTQVLEKSRQYDSQKEQEIRQLKQELTAEAIAGHDLFPPTLSLYEAYKLFNYDSAYVYAVRLQALAQARGNASLQNIARLKTVFILLSAGMYKETLDTLTAIRVAEMPQAMQAEYYILQARYYYDLGNYDYDPHFSPAYDKKGNQYLDSALGFLPPGSFDYNYYKGLKCFKSGDSAGAFRLFTELMSRPGLSQHELALTASTLSGIYLQRGEEDEGISLLARAAIADVYSATKETYAIFNLSSLLFKKGDVKHASLFIEQAVNNAVFYGARQRKVQLSTILPLIESEKLAAVEAQKQALIKYAIIVTLLVLVLIYL
ncbi:MAG: tetratricopeptide repeat protein, partial [Bacteroidetes bacterium]|nr:tetratricopeptide repeat protein [Bacteroidota bacterium]